MHLAVEIVALLAVAAGTAGFASRFELSAPLVLTALGLVVSFVPGVPSAPIKPEIVLIGLLPPLLYATAIRTPWVDLSRNRRAIGLLSVGLVLASAFAVGVVVHLVLPQVSFAIAVALGAVVSPPDAVAASAVARRVRMPRNVVALLEGESLLNDATALVTLRTAILAGTAAGSVSAASVGFDFLRAVVIGVATGWILAQAVSLVRRTLDPVLDTSLSLLIPYGAYLIAEELHGSGVIAVVLVGLMLGHRSTEIQSAAARVTENTIWRTVQFVLESVVFLLIGLQIKDLLTDAMNDRSTSNGHVAVLCGAVLLTLTVVRLVWVFPGTYLPRLIPKIRRAEPDTPPARNVVLVGWAGMRGVVTLAAALTLPDDTESRPALIVAAFAVVIGTLLLQGTTLPWLVRLLRVSGPDPAQDALQEALIQQRAAHAGLDRLDDEVGANDPPEVVGSLRTWGERVANAAWERLGTTSTERPTPAAAFYRLRVAMLESERRVVSDIRRSGAVPHDLAERVLERIDQEEAMLGDFSAGHAVTVDPDLMLTIPGNQAPCEHLQAAPAMTTPDGPLDACPDCLAIGDHNWVHLRMCLTCGHVGCCDSSPNRHSDVHYQKSEHPVMRSIELGEAWRWCFVDGELG